LPVSIYLHQGGHGGNPPADMLNRWFSHYLYGVDNGVEKDPPVWIVQDASAQAPEAIIDRQLAQRSAADIAPARPIDSIAAANGPGRGRGGLGPLPPTAFASFPVPGSVPVVLHPTAGGTTIANLSFGAAASGTDKLVDDVAMSGSVDGSVAQSPNRLL